MTVRVEKPSINVREKLAELDKPTGIAGEAMLRAETPQEQFNLIGAGRRNLIINGNFQVSQRGDYTTATTWSTNAYFLDRWKIKKSSMTGTIQDLGYRVKLVASTPAGAGGDQMMLQQEIEDKTIKALEGKVVTLSAVVKTNRKDCRLMYELAGTGLGWMSSNVYVNNEHSGSGQDETLIVTFKLPDDLSSIPVRLYVGFDSADSVGGVSLYANDYFEVTNVQLELGKVATPFEHRSYGEELALCQRYYYVQKAEDQYIPFGVGWCSTNQARLVTHLPVDLRATPSVGYGGSMQLYASTSNSASPTVSYGGWGGNIVRLVVGNVTTSSGEFGMLQNTIDGGGGYITYDAEL